MKKRLFYKLFAVSCERIWPICIVSLLLLMIASVNTEYDLTLLRGEYYKWNPMVSLESNWYYYPYNADEEVSLERYLRLTYGSMMFQEFRVLKDPKVDFLDDRDVYSYGEVFQASEEQLQELKNQFLEAEKIIPLSNLVEEETGFFTVLGIDRFLFLIGMWIIALLFGVFWFRTRLKQSDEILQYLICVRMNKNLIWKQYSIEVRCMAVFVWVTSFGAMWFPNTLQSFWRIYPSVILIVTLVISSNFLILYYFFKRMWNKKYEFLVERKDEFIDKYPYIKELSLIDNLKLILTAQGFSEKAAIEMIVPLLKEKGIEFCANRRMSQVTGDEWIVFLEIQRDLMKDSEEI